MSALLPKIFLLILLFSWPAANKILTGTVVGVTDGDTLTLLVEEQTYKIRFDGIDCPEKAQPFGTAARKFTSEKCFAQKIQVLVKGRDRYGRILGEVVLPNGENLNQELLRAGYAWWFDRYSKSETLRCLEEEAREARRGLWADPHPVAPWDFRKAKSVRSLLEK